MELYCNPEFISGNRTGKLSHTWVESEQVERKQCSHRCLIVITGNTSGSYSNTVRNRLGLCGVRILTYVEVRENNVSHTVNRPSRLVGIMISYGRLVLE